MSLAPQVLFFPPMRAARAKVVKGKIVTRTKFPEGAELTVVMREKVPSIDLTRDEEEAMLRGIAAIRAGNGVPLDEFRALLRRL